MKREIVEKIVMEVLQRIEKEKPKLIVVNGSQKNYEYEKKILKNHWYVIEATATNEIRDDTRHAVFLDVNQDLLAKAVLGITDTKESILFSHLMIEDYTIYFVLNQFLNKIFLKDPMECRNTTYVQQIHDYKERILSYGIHICSLEELVPETNFSSNEHPFLNETVVTKTDIETWNHKRMYIPNNAIITPLAIDFAKEKGIIIERISNGVE